MALRVVGSSPIIHPINSNVRPWQCPGLFALQALGVMLYFDAGMRRAPVAQLDRAMDFESIGRRFEPCRACHSFLPEYNRCISKVGIDVPVAADRAALRGIIL